MRRKSVFTALMVVLMLALVVGNAIAAWQDTKSTQVSTIVVEPEPAGTFRFTAASCDAYYGYSYSGWNGWCSVVVRNDTDEIMVVAPGGVVITTPEDTRIEEIEVYTSFPQAVNPRSCVTIRWYYRLQSGTLTMYEPVVFDVEVTASGN